MLVKGKNVAGDYGANPGERSMEDLINHGIVILDKPPGPTSHQTVFWLREILNVKKAGHTGTLDPGTTGVLLCCLGQATKIMPVLFGLKKEYVAVMHIHKEIGKREILKVCKKFTGLIKQRPPVRSAVKRETREREIYSIEILEISDRDVLMRVECQAGTYIRKLIDSIGNVLGTGAHMSELRRIGVGNFSEEQSCTLQDVKDAYWLYKEKGNESLLRKIILPVETFFKINKTKFVYIKDSAVNQVCNGAPVAVGGISKLDENIERGEFVAIATLRGQIVALGKALKTSTEILRWKKGLAVKTDRVMMPLGTYPKTKLG